MPWTIFQPTWHHIPEDLNDEEFIGAVIGGTPHTLFFLLQKKRGMLWRSSPLPCLTTPGFWTSSIVTRRGKVEEIANGCAVRCNDTPVHGHLLQAIGLNVNSCLFIKQRNSNVLYFCYKNVLQLKTVSQYKWLSSSIFSQSVCVSTWYGCLQSVWHIPVAVCTVLNSWWWMEGPSETCRVLFQNKVIWEIGGFSWFYYRSHIL